MRLYNSDIEFVTDASGLICPVPPPPQSSLSHTPPSHAQVRRRTLLTYSLPIRTRKTVALAGLAAFADAVPLAAAQHTGPSGFVQRVSSESLAVGRISS